MNMLTAYGQFTKHWMSLPETHATAIIFSVCSLVTLPFFADNMNSTMDMLKMTTMIPVMTYGGIVTAPIVVPTLFFKGIYNIWRYNNLIAPTK